MMGILSSPVWAGMLGVYALLAIAGVTLLLFRSRLSEKLSAELISRTKTWLWIVLIATLVFVLGKTAAILAIAFISFLALKEYFTLVPTRRTDRTVLLWAYLCIPIQYYWVFIGSYGFFVIFIPVYALLLIAFRLLLTNETSGFIKSVGTIHWGLMLTVYNLSHLAFLLVLPLKTEAPAGGMGLLFFAIFLIQFNDVAQYCWGKLLGRHKIVPHISPGKTWEGFIGGVVTTTVLALVLAPFYTPFTFYHALAAGFLISTLGFVGDVTLSAVKRDLGAKDSGSLLPGHGGVLDRLDSLTLSAPLFLHFTRYFYGL